jgi:hypothetical protein
MCERERRAYSPLAQTEGFMCILISWYPQNVCILCYLGSSHAHQLQKNLVDFGAMSFHNAHLHCIAHIASQAQNIHLVPAKRLDWVSRPVLPRVPWTYYCDYYFFGEKIANRPPSFLKME